MKTKAQKLCIVISQKHVSYNPEQIVHLDIRIERLSEEEDRLRYPFRACDEYANHNFRDVGSRAYLAMGQRPYGYRELEAWDVFCANVSQMKRRVAAIEWVAKRLEKIRLDAGYSDKFDDYIVRLATALGSDAIFVSNDLRIKANPDLVNRGTIVRGEYTRFDKLDIAYEVRAIVHAFTERTDEKQAAE